MKMSRLFMLLLFAAIAMNAQVRSAKIIYERKTNLYKKWKHESNIERWIKEEDKIKTDFFEMYVTDTFSVFQPQESDLREQYAWATSKNTVYQDFQHNNRYMVKTMWGEELHLTDSLYDRTWHISEGTRKIAGYHCRKAVWRANDSTRVYAWFSYDIVPSTGPESFNGLPGTILGLATEDGGVVYFAKKVEILKPEPSVFVPPKKKKKVYNTPELKKLLTEKYGHEKWFPYEMREHFGIW